MLNLSFFQSRSVVYTGASSTTLFKQACPASFGNQFVREQPFRFDKCAEARSGLGKTALHGRDANLVVLKAQFDLIPHLQAEGRTERRWDHHRALRFYAAASFEVCVGHIGICAATILESGIRSWLGASKVDPIEALRAE
jgi:hypothetical protein